MFVRRVVLVAIMCFGVFVFLPAAFDSVSANPTSQPAESFRFVIAADPHQCDKRPETAKAEFSKTIQQINALDPAFVVIAGDMISTGPKHKTDREVEAMWDQFDTLAAKIKAPVKLVPGNHDINTYAGTRKDSTWNIYTRRYGKTYYSFDYGNSHFIVLNAEAVKTSDGMKKLNGRLDEIQLQWLEKDLEKNKKTEHIFVFVHRPSWQKTFTSKKTLEFWRERIHPLLVRYGVDAVFAGHLHRYCNCGTHDGVNYYGLANCGGGRIVVELKNSGLSKEEMEKLGGFRHFLLMEVDGEHWACKIVKRDGVYPDNIVTAEEVQPRLDAIRKSLQKRKSSKE